MNNRPKTTRRETDLAMLEKTQRQDSTAGLLFFAAVLRTWGFSTSPLPCHHYHSPSCSPPRPTLHFHSFALIGLSCEEVGLYIIRISVSPGLLPATNSVCAPLSKSVAMSGHKTEAVVVLAVGGEVRGVRVSHVVSLAVSIPAIRYSIPYLEGSHDPDMMPEVVPRFEPFERCCMAILFTKSSGSYASLLGRGNTKVGNIRRRTSGQMPTTTPTFRWARTCRNAVATRGVHGCCGEIYDFLPKGVIP